jgi:hypothetical protein
VTGGGRWAREEHSAGGTLAVALAGPDGDQRALASGRCSARMTHMGLGAEQGGRRSVEGSRGEGEHVGAVAGSEVN